MEAIDIHFHVIPPLFVDFVRGRNAREVIEISTSVGMDRLVYHPPAGVFVEPNASLSPALFDERLILAGLDRRKLDAAAISPPPELFLYWAPAELGSRIARAMNDGMAELARAHPDRFLPLATLPLQNGAAFGTGLRSTSSTRSLIRSACTLTQRLMNQLIP